jgi:hypothetical protein
MVGVPEISGPQEKERNVEHTTQKERLHHGGSTVPSGEPGSQDKSEVRERERSQLCVQGGLTEGERTLKEDWLVVDGSWRCAGADELPCELVRE